MGFNSDNKTCKVFYPSFAERIGEVLILLYVLFVCLFFCSVNDFSATRGPIYAKFCMRRSLGRDVSSPLLEVGGSRRAEKGANEIFVTMGVNGEFLHFGGF